MGPHFSSLPELFRLNGYHTFGAGLLYHDADDPLSWSEPFLRPDLPKEKKRRIRIAQQASPNPWLNKDSIKLIEERLARLRAAGLSDQELLEPSNLRKFKGPPVEEGEVPDDAYFDGQTTSRILKWIDNFSSSKPFFLAIGFTAGHLPFNSPGKYWDFYNRNTLTLPSYDDPPFNSPEWVEGDSEPVQYYTQNGYEQPWHANKEQSMELLHGHYAAISYIDAMTGRILSGLKKHGLYENTVIVLTSDHGFHDAEHGYWGKHNLWDTSLAVPLLIRIPPVTGQIPGSRVSALTEHVDIFPTLCDLCGLKKPEWLEGDSFLPLIKNPELTWKKAVFAHRKHMWHDRLQVYEIAHSVRTFRYRYTVYLDREKQILYRELFDYQEDPLEKDNRSEQPEYAQTVSHLEAMLNSSWKALRPNNVT